MKKIVLLLFLFVFFPIAKAEFSITFMNATFPTEGRYYCSLSSNGKFYCSAPNSFYEYDAQSDTLRNIHNYTGYQKANCIMRPQSNEFLCVEGVAGCIYKVYTHNGSGYQYCMPYNGWIVCNNSGYSNAYYYGGDCFLNDEYIVNKLNPSYRGVGTVCLGGKVWVGYPFYYDLFECDALIVWWSPPPNPYYPGYYDLLISINEEPDIVKFGHSCVSYRQGETVCLGGNISHSDIKIVNGSVSRFRVTPDYWHMECVSPNLVSFYTNKSYEEKVYCIGGYNRTGDRDLNKIFEFNPKNNSFYEVYTLNFTIKATSCQPDFNGDIYCFGGVINNSYSNRIFKLTIKPTPPPVPQKVCKVCDYSKLNPQKINEYILIGACLFLNLIFCNSILFAFFFIFLLIIYLYKKLKK
ncbi:MAG: hypothetical protein QXF61_04380 [Nitrososphaeria archaeon]